MLCLFGSLFVCSPACLFDCLCVYHGLSRLCSCVFVCWFVGRGVRSLVCSLVGLAVGCLLVCSVKRLFVCVVELLLDCAFVPSLGCLLVCCV